VSKRPHLYGADLRCPTCGKPSYDMVAGFDLFDNSLGMMADNTVSWQCTNGHMNLTTLRVGEVRTRTL
jgi:hypothetical protein